jgi:hypothetical protein
MKGMKATTLRARAASLLTDGRGNTLNPGIAGLPPNDLEHRHSGPRWRGLFFRPPKSHRRSYTQGFQQPGENLVAAEQATNHSSTAAPARPNGETAWHHGWKHDFETCGATVEHRHHRAGQDHRADIFLRSGTVIEIQRGTLTAAEATRREHCYRRMVWVLDGTRLGDRLHIGKWHAEHSCGVWIKQGPRWWATLRHPRYIDLGAGHIAAVDHLDLLLRDDGTRPLRLIGRITFWTRHEFIAWAVTNL